MSNQLHRRLAFRTGEGATDTTSASFWDSSDFSTVHVVSRMELYRRERYRVGSGSSSNPYRLVDELDRAQNPGNECPEALFLTGSADPLIVFGNIAESRATLANSGESFKMNLWFRKHSFIGIGDRLAANVINGNVRRVSDVAMHYQQLDGANNMPALASNILSSVVARDASGVHWYFMQIANRTGYFFEDSGYTPIGTNDNPNTSTSVLSAHERPGPVGQAYTRVNISTNYGIRILHVATPNGGFPLESTTVSMVTSAKQPGTYQYHTDESASGAASTGNTAWGMMGPGGNRDLWDFTLLALKSGDMSPAGLFTNDVPVCMQCADYGRKMMFLSATSVNGHSISYRTMTTPWDVRTLTTTKTDRAMTDFDAAVNARLGTDRPTFYWTWFKFSTDGRKAVFLTCDGVLAKFTLTSAYDFTTMSLQTAAVLPAQDDGVGPVVTFSYQTSTTSAYNPDTMTGQNNPLLKNPIVAADMDPDGLSLIISVSGNRLRGSNTSGFPPFAHNIVQYRL